MLGAHLTAEAYLQRLHSELTQIDPSAMRQLADWIYQAYEQGNTVYFFGNGGSATTATHMSEDLGKSSLREEDLHDENRKRLRVMSLTDNVGWMLAIANDLDYDQIFVQQLMNFGQPGDLAVGISGSGNSGNVLNAIDWANRHGLKTFGFTGFNGGKLKQMAHGCLHCPLDDMGMVESLHLAVYHWVLNDVFARINGEGRYQTMRKMAA
ncbi:Phosphoheptose isomerase [Planctomycetales bacterium 10988]|nr:Phosphoheptose isomerase [Planctomycetales bacterium 10988]